MDNTTPRFTVETNGDYYLLFIDGKQAAKVYGAVEAKMLAERLTSFDATQAALKALVDAAEHFKTCYARKVDRDCLGCEESEKALALAQEVLK